MEKLFAVAHWWELVYIVSIIIAGIAITVSKRLNFNGKLIAKEKGMPDTMGIVIEVCSMLVIALFLVMPVINSFFAAMAIRKYVRRLAR